MPEETYAEWIEQQYTSALIILSVLIIVFHPAFHFILELLPAIPPDSLPLRLISVAVACVVLSGVLLVPALRRYSAWLQIINAASAIIITHLVVLNSDNHPMYLAASLTAVYGAQLSFIRLREWLLTVAMVVVAYVTASAHYDMFATPEGFVPPLFYLANYSIASALVAVRMQTQRREFESRLALQRSNSELRVITERLQNELVLAREIQQSLLPAPSPGWSRIDVVCFSQPAREVGGDFYSYHRFGEEAVALAVGDVSGKGASAALLMATSISLFNANVAQRTTPSRLLATLDQHLAQYTLPRSQNCALCYVEIDRRTVSIANAGAIPPFLRRRNGDVEWPDAWGFALGQGLGAQWGYEPVSLGVEPGDVIVLVSDGAVEAKNGQGTLFGFDRLEQAIKQGPAARAQAMVDHLRAELQAFVGATEPHDDVTIVVARIGASQPDDRV